MSRQALESEGLLNNSTDLMRAAAKVTERPQVLDSAARALEYHAALVKAYDNRQSEAAKMREEIRQLRARYDARATANGVIRVLDLDYSLPNWGMLEMFMEE